MFNVDLPLYGFCIIIGVILGLLVVYFNAKKVILENEKVYALLIYIALGAIIGAKYYTYYTNYEKFKGVFDFFKLGLSSYGAVIGILIVLFIYSKQFKIKYKDLIYLLVTSIPLMYGIGKIGCFLSGCCYGIKYNGIFKVIYNYSLSAPKGESLFPIQLLEAFVFILIFVYLSFLIKKEKNKDYIIDFAFILCGLSKFLLEYLRASHINIFLSCNQIVSLIFVGVGVCFILKKIVIKLKF